MKNKFVNIKWQDGVISKHGVNGAQVDDALKVIKDHLVEINEDHPCKENRLTITAIDNAINYQDMRTQDRVKRGVEGTNKK
ncbi:hypothetical protein [Apilactobacillus timberlakei]|uniref:hypothetical protein n=1 Tax=Apilactobacillus timberlakei TaxID=2008380 RepID=UPI00112D2FBC|nr:hypothetical protein [Apilactobacillus timberlakei]TPR16655.1 hypothetical protein DYZ95_07375 [Apilactobacillus timberlakei]